MQWLFKNQYLIFKYSTYYTNIIYYRYACGVEIGDKYIVTGGMNGTKFAAVDTVAEYSQSGFVKYLTPMNTARRSHACTKFVTDNGETVS